MKEIATRAAFGKRLAELAQQYENFVVIDADIAKSCSTDMFHKAYPGRSYNVGIAEQNLMGVSAGFASTGIQVFCATYAVFASMRACEQVRTYIAYPGFNVKILASHGGVQVGPDGATHQATEDIGIMRSISNMTIVHPADGVSAALCAEELVKYDKPTYVRLLRNPSPLIFDDTYKFEIGKAVHLKNYGNDLTLIGTGAMVLKVLQAAEALKTVGINARVLEIHTIKPIDEQAILECAEETGAILTAEDHNIIGGLGSAVADVLSENRPTILKRIGLKDVFGESGPSEELYDYFEMNVSHIVAAAKELVAKKNM